MSGARATALSRRLCAAARNAPLAVAHRGASGELPENTVEAFAAAVAMGCQVVELDFRTSRDGVLVCLHDETLDRTTDAPGVLGRPGARVEEVQAAELRRLDAGSWKDPAFRGARIPTLEEALRALHPCAVPMLEHKTGAPEQVVALLRAMGLVEDVVVQSFDWEWLGAVRALEHGLTLGALGEGALTAQRLRRLPALGVSLVHWLWGDLTAEETRNLARGGWATATFTVDADEDLVLAAAMGFDAVTTNRPRRLLELAAAGRAVRR